MAATMIQGLNLKGTGMFAPTDEPTTTAETPKRTVQGRPATDKQKAFIRNLLAEREGNPDAEALRAGMNLARENNAITTKFASVTIEMLLKIPKGKVEVEAPKGKQPGDRNLYPGKCEHCKKHIEADGGILDKNDDGKWIVTHEGQCPTAWPFPEGYYAIETDDGEMRFFHAAENGVLYVQASDSEYQLKNRKMVDEVVGKIAEDPLEAAKRYGIEFGRCGICQRGLTSDWRKVGIGPVCSKKL